MAAIQGVIFDMCGLMFDTEPVWVSSWTEVFSKAGLEVPDGMVEGMRGHAGQEMVSILRRFLGDHSPAGLIVDQVREAAYRRIADEGVPKKPGLDELLEYLHDCQIPMAVASVSPKYQIEANLARGNISSFFDVICSGESIGRAKPDPSILEETARLLGTEPGRTIVLEDSAVGVEAGWRGGFLTIMVPDGAPPTIQTRRKAKAVVGRLDDVIDLIEDGRIG